MRVIGAIVLELVALFAGGTMAVGYIAAACCCNSSPVARTDAAQFLYCCFKRD